MLIVYILLNLLLTVFVVEMTFKYFDSENLHLKISYLKYMLLLTTLCLLVIVYFDFDFVYIIYFYLSLILLIPLLITDAIYYHISSRYLIYLFAIFTIIKLWIPVMTWQDSLLGMIFAFFLLEAIILLSKEGMGRGDRNLLALFGYIMGFKMVIMTFIMAILFATVMLVFHMRKAKSQTMIPFGPYLIIAFLVNILFGDAIFSFYIQLY